MAIRLLARSSTVVSRWHTSLISSSKVCALVSERIAPTRICSCDVQRMRGSKEPLDRRTISSSTTRMDSRRMSFNGSRTTSVTCLRARPRLSVSSLLHTGPMLRVNEDGATCTSCWWEPTRLGPRPRIRIRGRRERNGQRIPSLKKPRRCGVVVFRGGCRIRCTTCKRCHLVLV